jgi:hypothetical protein
MKMVETWRIALMVLVRMPLTLLLLSADIHVLPARPHR